MITEKKVSDNQTVSVQESAMPKYHTTDDSVYMAEGSTISPEYREYLDLVLHNRAVAMSEEEYEDQRRYQGHTETAAGASATVDEDAAPQLPAKPQIAEQNTVRVFNQKRALWLALYILLALGVVLALIFTLPGTAWERKSITVSGASKMPVAEADQTPSVPAASINTIYTLDGRTVTVELEPYVEEKPATNWFDSFCDWLNNAVGG